MLTSWREGVTVRSAVGRAVTVTVRWGQAPHPAAFSCGREFIARFSSHVPALPRRIRIRGEPERASFRSCRDCRVRASDLPSHLQDRPVSRFVRPGCCPVHLERIAAKLAELQSSQRICPTSNCEVNRCLVSHSGFMAERFRELPRSGPPEDRPRLRY